MLSTGRGLREWLDGLDDGIRAQIPFATFDTRVPTPHLPGLGGEEGPQTPAGQGLASIVDPESFHVHGKAGPLADGEQERARLGGGTRPSRFEPHRQQQNHEEVVMTRHTEPGTIVVGVDGSRGGEAALEWAVDEASRRHLPLHLVHATNIDYLVAAAMLNPDDAPDVVDDAGRGRPGAGPRRRPDLTSGPRPRPGPPPATWWSGPPARKRSSSAPTARARARRAGLGLPPGRHARQVPGGRRARPGAVSPTGPVVVGIDGSALSKEAVGFAFEQASLRGVPSPSSTPGGSSSSRVSS